jgi:hypothetical protein
MICIMRFVQPDTLIPDAANSQAWNRYSYAANNPIRYNDPSGHCFTGAVIDTLVCAAVIGGLVSVAVDYFVTTQIDHEDYSWQQAGIAFGVGAVAGMVGVGIGALAVAAGGLAMGGAGALAFVPAAAAPWVGAATEVVVGSTLSAGANVALSSTHRNLDAYLADEEVDASTIASDIQEHWQQDAAVGAASYLITSSVSSTLDGYFIPPQNSSQQFFWGITQGTSIGVSNTDLLNLGADTIKRSRNSEGIYER